MTEKQETHAEVKYLRYNGTLGNTESTDLFFTATNSGQRDGKKKRETGIKSGKNNKGNNKENNNKIENKLNSNKIRS